PKKYSGSLDRFEAVKVTPHIGLEFRDLKLNELNDQQIEDLSILVSQNGVVFLRNQAEIDPKFQLEFGKKIGEKFPTPPGTLHIHPLTPPQELNEILVITNEGKLAAQYTDTPASDGWHSDFTFEKTPSNYAALQLERIPEEGGDTLWSSGYAAYDRLSKPLRDFLETLHAEHDGNRFHDIAKVTGVKIRTERGADNVGDDLRAVHPLIRTNPVTGWKSLFVNKGFTKRIVELSKTESDALLNFLFDHIAGGFDFQVRFKWNIGDIAIWDNRSVFHSATRDFDPSIVRRGNRVAPLGEKPYFDGASLSRAEA
ncbi:taurine catabolism dioxygenase, partial [Gonapodya prolifera JEL478]